MDASTFSLGRFKKRWAFAREAEVRRLLVARWRTKSRFLLLYKDAYFHAHPTATIELARPLHVGCRWENNRFLPSQLVLFESAALKVRGSFRFYTGCQISINERAQLILGRGYANGRLNLACFERIEIGDGVAIGENVTLRDSDTYSLKSDRSPTAPITIGNNVWLGLNSTVLKGVTVGDGAVVAAGAMVIEDVPPRSLVAGVPARVKKTNVTWNDELRARTNT